MTKRMAEKQRLLVGLIIAMTLVVCVGYVYVLRPLARSVSTLNQQVREAAKQVQQLEQLVAQAPDLRQETIRLQADVEGLRRKLPSEDELPLVIERLSELASQTGVKILSIFPQRSVQPAASRATSTASTLYKAVAIEIDALSGFHQFGMFLSRAESGEQPMEVTQLRMGRSDRELRRHTIKLVLLTYVTVAHDKTIPAPKT